MNTTDSVTRLGFDLRGLMALTSVAAFVTLASKFDLGSALVLAAIFTACALMAHFYPVGTDRRHRTMSLMFVLGIAIACVAYAGQYFIFGFRIYFMLGTALAICFGVAIGAAAICKPAWLRWSKRVLLSIGLLLFGYIAIHSFVYRDSIWLSLQNQVYFQPRYQFTEGDYYYSQNWLLNRLRLAFGLTDMVHIEINHDVSAWDVRALANAGSLSGVHFNGCNLDLPPGLMQKIKVDVLMFSSCHLKGKSLDALTAVSNCTSLNFANCEVDSFEGISRSASVRWINVFKTPISDEFVDEIVKLPTLRGISLRETQITDAQLELARTAKQLMISVD